MSEEFLKAKNILDKLTGNLEKALIGQKTPLQWLVASFASGGHVLLEDVPGTGKTTLAKALALSCEGEFQRIQFTPDLMPSDILGSSIFDINTQQFRFETGPVFCNILLADEINRASPRTQSALLEAMAESQVSIEKVLRPLPPLFFVIATQNPVEFHGTYPLPEAQLDRFALKFKLGYLSVDDEIALLTGNSSPLIDLKPCVSIDDILFVREQIKRVRISHELVRYIVNLVGATRSSKDIDLGASPRASMTLLKVSKALSLMRGLEFVTPDIIKELAMPVIAHRLAIESRGADEKSIMLDILQSIKAPL